MTQEEIRAERAKLDARIRRAQAIYERDLAIVRAYAKRLQAECQHPNKFTCSIMGRDTVTTCPDCGWDR